MKELIDKIELIINRKNLEFRKITTYEAKSKLNTLKQAFKFDFSYLYLWEHEIHNKKTYHYSNDNWSELMNLEMDKFSEQVYLVVTDDEFYPWIVFRGKKSDLKILLEEQRFFEFFIFDDYYNKILFDTHHNSLILMTYATL